MAIIAGAGSDRFKKLQRDQRLANQRKIARSRNPNIPRGTETWGDWGQSKEHTRRSRERYRRRRQGGGSSSSGARGNRRDTSGKGRQPSRITDAHGKWWKNRRDPNQRRAPKRYNPNPDGRRGGSRRGRGSTGRGSRSNVYRDESKWWQRKKRGGQRGGVWAGPGGRNPRQRNSSRNVPQRGRDMDPIPNSRRGRRGIVSGRRSVILGNPSQRGRRKQAPRIHGMPRGIGNRGRGGSFMAGGRNPSQRRHDSNARTLARRRRNQAGPQRGRVRNLQGTGHPMSNTWDLKNRRGARGLGGASRSSGRRRARGRR